MDIREAHDANRHTVALMAAEVCVGVLAYQVIQPFGHHFAVGVLAHVGQGHKDQGRFARVGTPRAVGLLLIDEVFAGLFDGRPDLFVGHVGAGGLGPTRKEHPRCHAYPERSAHVPPFRREGRLLHPFLYAVCRAIRQKIFPRPPSRQSRPQPSLQTHQPRGYWPKPEEPAPCGLPARSRRLALGAGEASPFAASSSDDRPADALPAPGAQAAAQPAT